MSPDRIKAKTAPIFVLTHQFPFSGGEQFLEAELPYWKIDQPVVFVPARTGGVALPLVDNMTTALGRLVEPTRKQNNVLRRAVANLLATEARRLSAPAHWHLAAYAAKSSLEVYRSLHRLEQAILTHGRPALVYCYWNDSAAYAAILAKRLGLVDRVISRAHGFDVYAERRSWNYQPFKAQLIGDFDAVCPVSDHASEYMRRHLPTGSTRFLVQRLGVHSGQDSRPSEPGHLHVVTVSSCVPVKRLDRVIAGLHSAAAQRKDLRFTWTHVGDGPLRGKLQSYARAVLGPLDNVNYTFLGNMSNDAVREFLATARADVALNTSEFEGIPVSLMEAMSHGIPAMAPSIAGIPELIGHDSGFLMSGAPDGEEVATHLLRAMHSAKSPVTRAMARAAVEEKYAADRNYPEFVSRCLALIDLPGQSSGSDGPA